MHAQLREQQERKFYEVLGVASNIVQLLMGLHEEPKAEVRGLQLLHGVCGDFRTDLLRK